MSRDGKREAAECRRLAAKYEEKADAGLRADRQIFMYFHDSFLELAEAYEQDYSGLVKALNGARLHTSSPNTKA